MTPDGEPLDRRESTYISRVLLVALVCATVLSVVALIIATIAIVNVSDSVDRQAEGRKVAIEVICGVTSGIIEAGRATITGQSSGGMDPEFIRNLEKLGYPPKRQREAAARLAAEAYARSIAERVESEAGVEGVVRQNGTLDCLALKRAAGAGT